MARQGTGFGFGPATVDTDPLPNLLILRDSDSTFVEWDVTAAAQNEDLGGNSTNPQNATMAYYFARRLSLETGRTVQVIASAGNSRAISAWNTGEERWVRMTSQVAASGVDRVDLILWSQGINDNIGTQAALRDALADLMTRVRALDWFDSTAPWVMVNVPSNFPISRAALATFANDVTYPYVYVANDGGRALADGIHWTTAETTAIGQTDLWRAFNAGSDVFVDQGIPLKIASGYNIRAANGGYIALPAGCLASFRDDFSIRYVGALPQKYAGEVPYQNYIIEIGRSNLFNALFAMRYDGTGVDLWIDDLLTPALVLSYRGLITTTENFGRIHTIVVTRKASDGVVKLYFNGELVGTLTATTGTLAAASNGQIGIAQDRSYGAGNLFVQSLTCYARVLTAAEAAASTPPTTPFLHYRCEDYLDGAANEIPDSSGNAYHGTFGATTALASAKGNLLQRITQSLIP